MTGYRLDRVEARRIAVRAQLLDAHRPTDLLGGRAWTRLGAGYQPAHLQQALEHDRTLYEHRAVVRPMTDLKLHLADMTTWPDEGSVSDRNVGEFSHRLSVP